VKVFVIRRLDEAKPEARFGDLVIGGIGAAFGSLERGDVPPGRAVLRRQPIKNPGIRRFQG
jgi:hypothetical protein